jgi:multisubunit Na+/H+ antiporter MnhG subunit
MWHQLCSGEVRTLADRLAVVAAVNTLVGGSTGETLGLALVYAGAAVPPWVTALLGAHAILHVQTILASTPCRAMLLLQVARKQEWEPDLVETAPCMQLPGF